MPTHNQVSLFQPSKSKFTADFIIAAKGFLPKIFPDARIPAIIIDTIVGFIFIKNSSSKKIVINGGIKSIKEGQDLLSKFALDGFMIGREVYKNPYILSSMDRIVFNSEEKIKSRYKVAMEMADYIDKFMKKEEGQVHAVTRHILGLYNSLPGAKEWRRVLSENTRFSKNGDILRLATDNIEEFIHTRSLILA